MRVTDHGFEYVRFSSGRTPQKLIRDRLDCVAPFTASFTGRDREVVTKLVNLGIDAHLEAFTESKFDDDSFRLSCTMSTKDVMLLLRRLDEGVGLDEYTGKDDEDIDIAHGLRASILSVIDIEEV